MKSFAGLQKNDVPRWVIESFASSGSNDVWTLQCFMMAVFNALMFPTSVLNINGSDFLYCKEIMRLEEFDWCQAVVDDIRDKVDRWRKNRDKATPLVQGCIAFIMIYYQDNLECDDMIADFVSIPRARFFTSTIIEKIASADLERERNDSCYANIGGDGPGGQGHVLESGASSAGFLYGKAAGVVKIPLLLKLRGIILLLKTKGLNLMLNIGVPSAANANTKRSKTKGQFVSKTIEHRHIPYGFLHLQPLLRGLGDYLSDGQRKREFLAALELHDKDVDVAIIKMNEAHKDIEEAQQKIVSEIKYIFGDLVGSSLNTESPRDARRKRRAERPLSASPPNVKRKSQTPREVSPAHTDGGDDGPEIVVERSPQLSTGQSSFEKQEAAHAPADTHVQHEVEQTVTVESVQEEVTHATLHTILQHEATNSRVDARAQQETLPPATATPMQHEPTQPAATTFVHDENEVGNILRELNEDPTQVSLRKEYDIKEAAALTGEKGASLELFELLAPGKIGHNVIEGTQQIIDSSDAMKDGVASCDVEKDDVASRDDQEDVARTNLE
ncbi:hypothetical protein GUJ93_ZPchr0008g13201 [Zizania palustris]|uniref:Uncharacterized protein n=1 Tax=Zizania palustris TaxID=103762 RepID=A0A8J5RH16_ZIZPA|nr:hypothetical protein GUJ93_ZPchr0008g13201 [Zizania palustris]